MILVSLAERCARSLMELIQCPPVLSYLPPAPAELHRPNQAFYAFAPCLPVAVCPRSAKYLNTGNFQIIPKFSRLRIKEKCLRKDAASSLGHALP